MTVDERVRHAMSGLKLKTDEVGRPPSHDEVEAVLRAALNSAVDEAIWIGMDQAHAIDGVGTRREQLEHLGVKLVRDLKQRYEKLPGLKSMCLEFAFEGQLYSYGFSGPGYSEGVKAEQRREVVRTLRELDEVTKP